MEVLITYRQCPWPPFSTGLRFVLLVVKVGAKADAAKRSEV